MAKKNNTKSKKTSMRRKSMKNRSRKYRNLYKGGSCECQKNSGGGKMTGGYGAASYQPISNAYFNSYQSNPNIIPFPAIENNHPGIFTTGGKKNKKSKNPKSKKPKSKNPKSKNPKSKNPKSKTQKNQHKIMHGGNFFPQSFGNNYILSTGDTNGAFLNTNIINGISNNNSSITESPLLYPLRVNIA